MTRETQPLVKLEADGDYPEGYALVQIQRLLREADALLVVHGLRLSRDEYGLTLAMAAALRADCTRRRIAAVIIDTDHRVAGIGYNGAAPGAPGCLTAGACPRGQQSRTAVPPGSQYTDGAGKCIAFHAERNAKDDVEKNCPERLVGATIYISDEPCIYCQEMLLASPLVRAVWPSGSMSLVSDPAPAPDAALTPR